MSEDIAALDRVLTLQALRATAAVRWANTPENRMAADRALDRLTEHAGSLAHLLAELDQAIEFEHQQLTESEPELLWVERTMRDVRTGDVIRLAGSDSMRARVVYAETRPRRWHVKAGDHPAGWRDQPLEHERSHMRLDYPGAKRDTEGRPALLDFPPDMSIEIQLTATELQVIELMGWDNRLERIDTHE